MVPFPALLRRVHLAPRLQFTNDADAGQLGASAHKHMEQLFNASRRRACPNETAAGPETRLTEAIGIDSGREFVVLCRKTGLNRGKVLVVGWTHRTRPPRFWCGAETQNSEGGSLLIHCSRNRPRSSVRSHPWSLCWAGFRDPSIRILNG